MYSRKVSGGKVIEIEREIIRTFTNFRMCDWKIRIAVECFFAIVAMSTDCIVFALHTDAA